MNKAPSQATSRLREPAGPNLYPGYLHFSLRSLVTGTEAPCPIRLEAYNSVTKRLRLVEVLGAGRPIDSLWLDSMMEQGIAHGYVTLDDLDALQAYLHGRIASASPDQADESYCHLVYENAQCCIKAAMLQPRNGRRLGMAVNTINALIDDTWQSPRARGGLLKVMRLDREVYSHSVNVCLLGVGLATAMDWGREERRRLGQALFFHDLGLADSPLQAMEPSQALAQGEAWDRHPDLSVGYLKEVGGLDPSVLRIIARHHENLDGSGFPRGLSGEELEPADRLARLIDLYESATSGIFTGQPQSPFQTLSWMRQEMNGQLDLRFLEEFVRFLGQS